jgi:PAS domain S-box-containing protein
MYMMGACVDITDQKNYEEILKKSESRFRTLTDNLPQMVWVTDSAGKTEYVSRRWKEYSGIVDDIEAWAYMVHPDDWEPLHRCWQEQFKNGLSFKYEVRLRNRDGEYRWHYSIAEPVKNNQGEVLHWVGVLTDIEDQKNIADILRKSEQYFRQLADMIPQIIWTATADGSTDYFNSRWYEFTGSAPGYGDQSWTPVLHPDDLMQCVETWHQAVKTGDPYQVEYRFREAATGNYRWFLGKAIPIRNSEGVITRWFGACTDIHDQKMMRVHLEQLVNERTKELRRSNEDLQQFAHVASHDLKEPVRKVIIFGSRLREEFDGQIPDRAREYIAKMEKAAHRMYSMIDGVLMYSSINASRHAVEEVDLNVVLGEIESDLEVFIHEKKAKVTLPTLPVIPGSQILIHQLFYNIINNCLKFSRPGVDLSIEIGCSFLSAREIGELGLESGRPYVRISIQDNGIGFSDEEAERIFDTFTRLHAKDKFEGTGLGLALCKKIVERHGGQIFAAGVEGKGAQVIVILPME